MQILEDFFFLSCNRQINQFLIAYFELQKEVNFLYMGWSYDFLVFNFF